MLQTLSMFTNFTCAYHSFQVNDRENMLSNVDRIIILSGLHSVIKKLLVQPLSFSASYTLARFTLRFFSFPLLDALIRFQTTPFNLATAYRKKTFLSFKLEKAFAR